MWTKLKRVIENPQVRVAAVSVFSAAAGAGSSYILTRKAMTAKYEKLIGSEVEAAKTFYEELYRDKVNSDNGLIIEAPAQDEVVSNEDVRRMFRMYGPNVHVSEPTGEETFVPDEVNPEPLFGKNVFDSQSEYGVFDLEVEMRNRTPDAPYIITQEEFFENENNYEQISISWYAGDGVFADHHDEEIQDQSIIGVDNLKFGYGSRDKNIVYIRNDELDTDWEVAFDPDSYSSAVAGLDEGELKHSFRDHRKPRKFKLHGED